MITEYDTPESMEAVDIVDDLMRLFAQGREPTANTLNRAKELSINVSEIKEVVGGTYGLVGEIDEFDKGWDGYEREYETTSIRVHPTTV